MCKYVSFVCRTLFSMFGNALRSTALGLGTILSLTCTFSETINYFIHTILIRIVHRNSPQLMLSFCRRQKAVTVDPMVFACVAMMSQAIGPKISKEVKDLLEPMLSVGLR